MRSAVQFALVLVLLAPAVFAEDPKEPAPPAVARPRKTIEPRKFQAGKLTDPYWGVTYELAGLEEKKGPPPAGKLLDGKSGRMQVEVAIWEYADQLSAPERRDAWRRSWEPKHSATAKDLAQGDAPAPWVTFEEEAPSGGMRRHAYAWFVRGCRAFVVHAAVMSDAEGGAESVKTALGGLEVGPETGAAVHVQLVSRQKEMPYDDADVLKTASEQYLEANQNAPPRPAIAEELLLRAVENLSGSTLERRPAALFDLHAKLGTAQLMLKKVDAAVASFTRCATLAETTEAPGPNGERALYDLACAYSVGGRLDEAFAALDKAYAHPAWPGHMPDEHLAKDPDLENCRKDPRWAKFLETKASRK